MMRRALLLALAAACLVPTAPEARAQETLAASDVAEKAARRKAAADAAGADAVLLVLSPPAPEWMSHGARNPEFEFLCPAPARAAAILVCAARPAESKPATGADPADVAAVPAAEPMDRIYLPQRSPALERWTGAERGPEAATAAALGFRDARVLESLSGDLVELLKDRGTLYLSANPAFASELWVKSLVATLREKLKGRWVRVVDEAVSAEEFAEGLRSALPAMAAPSDDPAGVVAKLPAVDVRRASRVLAPLREVKSPAEIERVRRACAATCAGIRDALRAAAPGQAEYQMAALVELRCRQGGCSHQSFPSIVGSGPNSCVLHYEQNRRTMAAGEVVVLDVGGEYEGYAADVTRTFPVSGRFTDEQAVVYDAVLAAQEAGLAVVKPGATMLQVHQAASKVLEARGLVKHFIHFTSHSVGLEVHDPMGREAKLRAGCILTVEPGVYDAARSIGVRIEDTVLVTATGYENLSAGAPRGRAEIEKLMAEEAAPGLLDPR